MSKTRTRARSVSAPARKALPRRDWPRLLGEPVLLLLVLAVPIVINTYSRNFLDLKDATLGLGVTLGLSLWLIAGLAQGRLSWATSRLNVVVLALLVWAGISVCYAQYWFVAVSEFGRLAANVGLFLLALVSLRTLKQVHRVIAATCVSAVPVCIYAFMQATGHDFIHWDVPVVRVHSFIGNSTYLGGYTALLIPLVVAVGWPHRSDPSSARRPSLFVPVSCGILAVMLTITLFLSFTLASIIGLGLGAVVACTLLVVHEGKRAIKKVGLGLLLAAVVATPAAFVVYHHIPLSQQERVETVLHLKDPQSAERTLHWRVAYQLFRAHPVLGTGYGTFRVHSLEPMGKEWYSQQAARAGDMLAPGYAHNEFLQMLADDGVIGGALFVLLVIMTYVTVFRVAVRHPDPAWRRLGLGGAVAVTAFFFQNMVGVTFRQTGTVTFFWLWLVLLVLATDHLPRGAAQGEDKRWHELSFRPRPIAACFTALVAGCAVALVAWLTIRPAIANVTIRGAQILASKGQQEAAISVANRTLELAPYSALAYYTLAFSYGNLGDYDRALQANLKALELMPGNGSALYNLGVVYKQMGRLDEAADAFRRAVEVMPSSQNYIGLAETLLKQNKPSEAEEQARTAIEFGAQEGGDPARQAQLHLLLASIAFQRNDMESMLAYVRKAVAVQPTEGKVQSDLVQLLLSLKRDREAAEAARAWLQADPQAAKAYFALGIAQYNLKDYAGAKEHLGRAVALDSSDRTARLFLAYTLGKTGDLSGSRRELEYLAANGGDTKEAAIARSRLARPPSAP